MANNPVRVTVSQVRQKIFEVSGRPGEGAGRVAGQLFHRTAECALRDQHPACWKNVLTSTLDEQEWLTALYEHILGPELIRAQPSLAESGEEVLKLWSAVQQFVRWFCGLVQEAVDGGMIRYDGQREEWRGSDSLFQSEYEVERIFHQPEWSRPVMVSGRLDQFVRQGPDQWCAVEFKVGGGHAEADAAQLCLYRELLGGDGSAALLHFGSDVKADEIFFPGPSIDAARPTLLALIGALAGVTGTEPGGISVAVAAQDTAWPKQPGEDEIEIGKKLERALREYGADAQLAGEPLVGPTFVRYLIEPHRGVTVNRIEKRGAELQVRLQLDQEPVIHRVEGRIAVDVQRPRREYVPFSSLRAAFDANRTEQQPARVLAGVDLRGKIHFLHLAHDSPHILVGGHSGSGKTEWLRAAVASLVIANTPDSLRLAVVDPKKNAFPELAGSPFLWNPAALIDSPDSSVLSLLEDLIEEMSRRQGLFKKTAADDLTQYRQKTGESLPRIVCVVDEFAELLLSGGRKQRDEFEQGFIRIAAVGRSSGIHLILATQRPSRQVVSGNLKANLPVKIALRVSTRIDSGVLIDQPGAQHLLGKGDLLLAGLSSEPLRLQSAWLSEEERHTIFRGVSQLASAGSRSE